MAPDKRPRRLRADGIRPLVTETRLSPAELIAPAFVDATATEPVAIEALPGFERHPVEEIASHVEELRSKGVRGVILFGIPEKKDEDGTRAWASEGVIQRALRHIDDDASDDITVITDVCLCEYTDHGHCGLLAPDSRLTVANDPSVDALGQVAVSHTAAGADMVAPSASLDGMVGGVRASLDEEGFTATPIMSYSVKFHSALYGPFREAADGAPTFGDRRHYQMDPGNVREARREARLDVAEGADIVMVKPALAYLDVIRAVADVVDIPVAAYNVSGEYAMIAAAADRGWLDLTTAAHECLLGIKRAGASPIISYFTPTIVDRL